MHKETVEHSCFDRTLPTREPDKPRVQQKLYFHGSCKLSKSLQENQTHAQGFDSLFSQRASKPGCNFPRYILHPPGVLCCEKGVIWGGGGSVPWPSYSSKKRTLPGAKNVAFVLMKTGEPSIFNKQQILTVQDYFLYDRGSPMRCRRPSRPGMFLSATLPYMLPDKTDLIKQFLI